MVRRPPRSTRTDTLFPYTTLFRSLEGLGDQIGRLWPLARKQAFGEGRDEDHRHRELLQNVVHRVDARASVTELNVCKYDAGPRLGDRRQGFLVRGGRSASSEERRGGKECVRTCRSWWSPYH